MPGGFLFGYYSAGPAWIEVKVDSQGRIVLSGALLFEDTPTDGEMTKGPTSNWAYDHANDAAAHHAKYTDAEARAAINNILDAAGKLTGNLNCGNAALTNIKNIIIRDYYGAALYSYMRYLPGYDGIYFYGDKAGGGYLDFNLFCHDGTNYHKLCRESVADSKIATHAADDDAHHAKYTDAEAQAACGLDGTLYYSLPGVSFTTDKPDVDDITMASSGYIRIDAGTPGLRVGISLPHGATVTGCIVYGNAAATDTDWYLYRVAHDSVSSDLMATAAIDTEDTSISDAVIDNGSYVYLITTGSLAANDQVYGLRITYTI